MYGNLAYGHSANEQLPLFHLAAGVTSVLSPGSGNPEGEIALRNRIDAGDSAGPRIFAAGEYIEMAPTRAPGMPTVETREEARLKINHWASRGADAIKIYAGMRGEILDAAVARAHAHGARVTAHLGATGWADAIRSGVDVIYHGVYSFPEIEPEWMDPKAIGMINFAPPEFDKYYKAIVEADLSQPKIRELFRLAAAAKVVFVPTVVALEPYDAEKQRMPDQKQFYSAEGWQVVEKRLQSPKKQYAVLLTKKNMEFVRLAHEAGCMLSTGTDLTNFQILPGFALWREIELFAEAGLKPMDVLRAATFNGAYAVGRSDSLGTVEGGKLADFVILNANPLENISNVRSVHRVVKGGVVYDPQELLKRLKGRVH
ncbi:MAG: amidohydrolase family protein, partial [Pyrinomonadaceae bacterium]